MEKTYLKGTPQEVGVVTQSWLICAAVLTSQFGILTLAYGHMFSLREILLTVILVAASEEVVLPFVKSYGVSLAIAIATLAAFCFLTVAISLETLLFCASALLVISAWCVSRKIAEGKDRNVVFAILLVPLVIDWIVAVKFF